MHLLGIETCTDAGRIFEAHGFTTRLTAHGILVIVYVEENRQATLHIAFPQFLVLVHGGHHEAFPDGTAA